MKNGAGTGTSPPLLDVPPEEDAPEAIPLDEKPLEEAPPDDAPPEEAPPEEAPPDDAPPEDFRPGGNAPLDVDKPPLEVELLEELVIRSSRRFSPFLRACPLADSTVASK